MPMLIGQGFNQTINHITRRNFDIAYLPNTHLILNQVPQL